MLYRTRVHREIWEQLWNGLRPEPDAQPTLGSANVEIRYVPDRPSELIARLAEQFDVHDLIAAGIAVRSESEVLVAAPRLAGGTGPVLRLSPGIGMPPLDLLLPDGLLYGSELPWYAMAHDRRVQSALQNPSGPMLLVCGMEDVVRCLTLGLAVGPATGLEQLQSMQLRALEELTASPASRSQPTTAPVDDRAVSGNGTHDEAPATTDHPAQHHIPTNTDAPAQPAAQETVDEVDQIDLPQSLKPMDIVVSGWSFGRQCRVTREDLRYLIRRLADGQRHLLIDLSAISVWVPAPDAVERLSYCWQLADVEAYVAAVSDSIGSDLFDLQAAVSGNIPPWQTPGNFIAARRTLSRLLHDPDCDANELKAASDSHAAHVQREMVEPFLTAAGTGDPVLGHLRMEFGQLSGILHCQAPFLQKDVVQVALHPHSSEMRARLEHGIRIRSAVLDRWLRIARELQQ